METAEGKVRAINGSDWFFGFATPPHSSLPHKHSPRPQTSTSVASLTLLVTYQSSENNGVAIRNAGRRGGTVREVSVRT